MGYEFLLVTREKPRWKDLLLESGGAEAFFLEAPPDREDGVSFLYRRGRKTFFRLEGPFPARFDDPDLLFVPARDSAPKWISTIQAPCFSGWRSIRRARRWALEMAGRKSGLAVDLATRELLEAGDGGKSKPWKKEIPILDLEWFLPDPGPSLGKARRFLEILEGTHRAFLPSAFGRRKACQTPFHPDRPGPFLELWHETGMKEEGGMFFWDARRPCLGGMLSFGDKRVPPDFSLPEESVSMIRIHLSLDAGVLEDLPPWREKTVDLFVRVARELGAFYGAGAVFRETPLDSGPVLHFHREIFQVESLHPQVNWSGLPSLPAWLHWFGHPYAEEAAGPKSAGETKSFPEGFLLRFGEIPVPNRELEGLEPLVPKYLAPPAKIIPAAIANPPLEKDAPPRKERKEVGVRELLLFFTPFKFTPLAWLLALLALLAALGVALGLGFVLAVKFRNLPAGLHLLLVGLLAGIPAFLSALFVLWAGRKALVALGLSLLRGSNRGD